MKRNLCDGVALMLRGVVSLVILSASLLAATRQPGYPVPQVAGPTNPQSVVPGGSGFTLTVYGANFIPGSTVNWNRQPRVTTYISARELQAQIPATDIALPTAGMITVTSTSPNGPITSSTYIQVEVHEARATMGSTRLYTYQDFFAFPAAIGDLNNDGFLDLAGTRRTGGIDMSLINNRSGVFFPSSIITTHRYGFSDVVKLADFNGDGNLDYLYVIGNTRQVSPVHLGINFGNGDGTFSQGPIFGSFPNGGLGSVGFLAVGDYNQDGVLDIATMPGGSNNIEIFLGNGDGTFTQAGMVHAGPVAHVVTGDFNGDGKLDLLGLSINHENTQFEFKLFPGNGDGTFRSPLTVAAIPVHLPFATVFTVNDFDNDGNLDIAFSNSLGQIGIILGNGDGTFRAPAYYTVGDQYLFSFAVGDFNNDGKTDIIVQQYITNTNFSILLGNGDGTFQSPQVLPVAGVEALDIIVADFQNDGLLDFYYPDAGYVYLQQ